MKALKILFLVVFSYFSGYAQDPQLFENTWYLNYLEINNELFYPPNESLEVPLYLENVGEMTTEVCGLIGGSDIYYDPNNIFFTVGSFVDFLIDCNTNEGIIFQNLYFYDFFIDTIEGGADFIYLIENGAGNSKILTLTNEFGYIAVYGNELLSIQEFSENLFSIYPNPVKNVLFISKASALSEFKATIFDIDGKLILTMTKIILNNKAIDVQNLNKGLYFITLENKEGQTITKKFIKN